MSGWVSRFRGVVIAESLGNLCEQDIEEALATHEELLAGLRAIVERADNGELGTSKVQDMKRLSSSLLAKHGGAQ